MANGRTFGFWMAVVVALIALVAIAIVAWWILRADDVETLGDGGGAMGVEDDAAGGQGGPTNTTEPEGAMGF